MRLFVQVSQCNEQSIALTERQYHHLTRVLRVKKGEMVSCVVSSLQEVWHVEVVSMQQQSLFFQNKQIQPIVAPLVTFTLIQALPKQDKLLRILDDCTQCGVHVIRPVTMARSITKIAPQKEAQRYDRWVLRAEQAAIQAQRESIPIVKPLQSFKACLETIDLTEYDVCLVAWEEEQSSTLTMVKAHYPQARSILLVVGPEGGITEHEVAWCMNRGFKIISLGSTIFRVELAAVVAFSQLELLYR